MPARKRLNSRKKGARVERALANLFKEWGFPAERTAQRSGKAGGPFDVLAPTMPIPQWESKGEEQLNLHAAMARAAEDADGRVWGLAWRKKRQPWIFCLHEEALKELFYEYRSALVRADTWQSYAEGLRDAREKAAKPTDEPVPPAPV